jgi:hypothetical protein
MAHTFGAFTDRDGTICTIQPFARGTFMNCYTIDGRPGEIFKAFSEQQIASNYGALRRWTENKNHQYQQLLNAGVSVAPTYPVAAGWVQEKCAYTLEHQIPEKLIPQVKQIFSRAWQNQIHIDGMPRNFGYNSDGVVKLFDFREEVDADDLECDLQGNLRAFEAICPGSACLLDPR